MLNNTILIWLYLNRKNCFPRKYPRKNKPFFCIMSFTIATIISIWSAVLTTVIQFSIVRVGAVLLDIIATWDGVALNLAGEEATEEISGTITTITGMEIYVQHVGIQSIRILAIALMEADLTAFAEEECAQVADSASMVSVV
ncbi:hypothetical protein Tsp_03254 [Trichinella spiralis]|uniref:hypothetical protein n=1 Tax=Trichinella spiralis TaxID=6334 RepID=UPI0001EFC3A8|nr:hypothetical protein Tsp_03254 [Trichinella spiralis]